MSLQATGPSANQAGTFRSEPPSDSTSPADAALLAMISPLEIPTPLWNLSSAGERRELLTKVDAKSTSPAPGGQCTVEVRYNPVALGASHAFIVTTDHDSQSYFRGGPSAGGPSSSSSGQLGSASGGSASGSSNPRSSNSNGSGNSSSPGSSRGGENANNGAWGPIVVEHGAYRPGTVDWNTDAVVQTVTTRAGTCDVLEVKMARTADAIEAAHIPYNPLSTNSNATARTILEGAGVTAPKPDKWVPGWNTSLPVGR